MVKLDARSVLGIELALPQQDEQSRILEIVDQQRTVISSFQRDLEMRRWLKLGLMNNLLTGCKRVRVPEGENEL